jgi:hypothetical protein
MGNVMLEAHRESHEGRHMRGDINDVTGRDIQLHQLCEPAMHGFHVVANVMT